MSRKKIAAALILVSASLGGAQSATAAVKPASFPAAHSATIQKVQYIKRPRFQGDTAEFRYPRLNGANVDACETWGQNCGAGGANQYCRLRHFSHALNWNIFVSNHTFLSSENRFCNGTCRAFIYVKCG